MKNQDEFQTYLDTFAQSVRYQDTFSAPKEGEIVFYYNRPFWTFTQYSPEKGPVQRYEHSITGSMIEKKIFTFWPEYVNETPEAHKKWAFVVEKVVNAPGF